MGEAAEDEINFHEFRLEFDDDKTLPDRAKGLKMNLEDAISVIDSCSGFTDPNTPAGEAWEVVQSFLNGTALSAKDAEVERWKEEVAWRATMITSQAAELATLREQLRTDNTGEPCDDWRNEAIALRGKIARGEQ